MCAKKNLEFNQMSSVDQAADYASRLLQNEARGPGDTELAMRRIEAKYGVGYWTLWGLRYKRPKSITADVFYRIRSAYLAACERQLASVSHNVTVERAMDESDDLRDMDAEISALEARLQRAKQALGRD